MRTLFALFILTVSLAAQSARVEEIGKSPVETKFASGGRIHMDLCSSGIELIGRDENAIRVSYHPEKDTVKVRIEIDGDRADLRVSRCPHNDFQMRIEVPKSSGLYVRMFAGELDVRGITGDKDVELSAGQLTMEVGTPEDYARVDASVNSGEINAPAFDVEKGGLFRSFDRTGPGKFRIHAHVGAGELDLR
jgi:hypothetical protein